MTSFKKILLLIVIFYNISVQSQNSQQKWQFNAGMNALIYRHPVNIDDNLFMFKDANFGLPLSQISASRHLFGGFSPEIVLGTAMVTQYPAVNTTKNLLANGMLNLKYSLANNYILKNTSFIEPFLKGGIGQTYRDNPGNKFFTTYDFGGGLAFWLNKNKNIGLQLQQMYHAIPSVHFNNEDYFDYSANMSYRFGMKDMDKDGIADDKDECPMEVGSKANKGCPDKDGDGIIDKNDVCPNDPGEARYKGCPDKDGDTIPDIYDKCPDIPGHISAGGCPDIDGDGIEDKLDRCPNDAGLAKFKGCPDKDKDSVPDIDDVCPKDFGLVKFNGCPDTDNDSVPDNVDKCPNEKGTVSNNGCPEEKLADTDKQKIEEQIAFHAKSIFFEVNKHKILPQSYPMLNQIASIIEATPTNTVFVVEGHTDNQGNEAKNLELSRNRANAVKEYLMQKGIGIEKLQADGYGIKYPIAENNTAVGRAKNRRVDITVKR